MRRLQEAMLTNDLIRKFAPAGAAARLQELDAERQAILRAFPDLGSSPGLKRPVSRTAKQSSPAAKPRRRGKMTTAQKKAVSIRMKKYWAAWRKRKGR